MGGGTVGEVVKDNEWIQLILKKEKQSIAIKSRTQSLNDSKHLLSTPFI